VGIRAGQGALRTLEQGALTAAAARLRGQPVVYTHLAVGTLRERSVAVSNEA
jgi:hypothetical protein